MVLLTKENYKDRYRFLLFKIDFNEYYEIKKMDKQIQAKPKPPKTGPDDTKITDNNQNTIFQQNTKS